MRRVFSVVIPEKPDPSDWQPFRFGGKENLGSVGLNLLDFGARMFSPSAMRWTTMDPMAEKYYDISPYVYCAGNPVFYFDPDGKDRHIANNKKTIIIEATFYVGNEEYNNVPVYDQFSKAARVLNRYRGLTYSDDSGTSKVAFNIVVRNRFNPEKDARGEVGSNYVVIEDTNAYRKDSRGNDILGEANGSKKVLVHKKSLGNIGVIIHEMLHALGAAIKKGPNGEVPHHDFGYMTSSINNQSEEITQQTIDEIIENGYENTR